MKIALEPWAYEPTRGHDTDAGLDLRTPFGFVLEPKTAIVIDTGVHVEIPENHAGFLKSKSGLNVKYGIQSEGVVDFGYNGTVICKLINHGKEEVSFKAGDKITQLVVLPVLIENIEFVDEIVGGERGKNGFGSTGR